MVATFTRSQRKRKRKSLSKINSLEYVSSAFGSVESKVVTLSTKELVLERLRNEIIKFQYSLRTNEKNNPKCVTLENNNVLKSNISQVLKQRIIIGSNQCTRKLEMAYGHDKANSECHPMLLLLSRDVRPPTILCHIPALAKKMDIPLILLPGKASRDLGNIFNIKRASVVLFLSKGKAVDNSALLNVRKCHESLDSMIGFLINQMNELE